MPTLDIWFKLKVGQQNYAGAHPLIAGSADGRVSLSTTEPMKKINYPAIRAELHSQLDLALDRIQANQPEDTPFVS